LYKTIIIPDQPVGPFITPLHSI